MPAVTAGCCVVKPLVGVFGCVPARGHLPATGGDLPGGNGRRVGEQTGAAEAQPLISVLFPCALLLELVCAAEVAAFSNYSWQCTVVIIVKYN